METEAERKVLEHILPHRGVVVEMGEGREQWVRDVLALRPELAVHRVADAMGKAGLEGGGEVAGMRRIHCLRIEPLATAARVLGGGGRAAELLRKRRIDSVRFTYEVGDRWEDFAGVFEALARAGYAVLKLGAAAARLPALMPGNRQAQVGSYLALAPRFLPDPVTGETILNIPRLLRENGIGVLGVVHVGAHTCQELPLYKGLGVPRILFIEANPEICEKMRQEHAADGAVRFENLAISDSDGSLTLHMMSESQSSSILPLKHHKHYYPEIHETKDVTVPARRLETLFGELKLNPAEYNYLHLDIQGAELLALAGAKALLPHFDVVSTELNYDELYEGCALAEEMEDFLEGQGFRLASVLCSCSASWGDAFFVRGARAAAGSGGAKGAVQVLGKTATGGHIVSFGAPR